METEKRSITPELEDEIFQAILSGEVKPGHYGEYSDVEEIEKFVAQALLTIAVCD